jgi:L-amino acid N-acyltransferase YncA
MIEIRPATDADWPAIWAILQPIIREGETLALPREASEAEGRAYFASAEKRNFVAVERQVVLGASYLRANQAGGGAHVANAGYITAPAARGRGVARQLCAHSLQQAKTIGFKAVQFNFVVSSNAPAVHLWEAHGFRVLTRLPGAFLHPRLGFVDALVMWRDL